MIIRLIWSDRISCNDGGNTVRYIYTELKTIDNNSEIATADGVFGCEKLDANLIRVICRKQYPFPPGEAPYEVTTQIIALAPDSPALTKCTDFPELIGVEKNPDWRDKTYNEYKEEDYL